MEGLWVLAILWAVLSVVGRIAQRGKGGKGRVEPDVVMRRPRRVEPVRRQPARVKELGQVADQLEAWRREMERLTALPQASRGGPLGPSAKVRLPEAEDVEERESLEIEREDTSLEVSGERAERVVVDRDDVAVEVARSRQTAAEARLRGRTSVDHRTFDQVIRTAPAPVAVRGRSRLATAVIWREILERPVSLRDGL